MAASPLLSILLVLIAFFLSGCRPHEAEPHHHAHPKIVVTRPKIKDVVLTQQYVCQIHSRRDIEVCALEEGYLEEVAVREGQAVKKGDLMFKILPTLYQAKLDAELAEVQLAQIEFDNTKKLFADKVVSQSEVALHQAKLAKAKANAELAEAELNFASVKAPFDGIVDRLHEQLGSLVEEGAVLTTLSDNSLMWVYFNVPEARYLEYMTGLDGARDDDARDADGDDDKSVSSPQITLVLADGSTFPHLGKIGAIEAKFNNETGNIPFRADFPNPDGLLRHGQTGNVLIHRTLENAVVIPQRAVFETLNKQYVFVVDEDGVVHQREIVILNEMDDVFVIERGLDVNDKFVLDGVRQVHDGEKVKYEFREPDEVMANQKHHAE